MSIFSTIKTAGLITLLVLHSSMAMARERLTEDELRQVSESLSAAEPYGEPVNYLQRTVEQDRDDTLQRRPAVLTERQSALLNGQTTPALVAEENYRDWLLSGTFVP